MTLPPTHSYSGCGKSPLSPSYAFDPSTLANNESPLLFYPPLVETEPGHEPGGLEDVDHDQPDRAEYTEGLESG